MKKSKFTATVLILSATVTLGSGCATSKSMNAERNLASVERNSPDAKIICTEDETVAVYSVKGTKLGRIISQASQFAPVSAIDGKSLQSVFKGEDLTFIEVKFNTTGLRGWVAENVIQPASACSSLIKPNSAGARPDLPKMNCAEWTILNAAKQESAQRFDNREPSGQCALGVDFSLQRSHVGTPPITSGIGNAMDFVANLSHYGFVEAESKDPNTTVPGSVLVFSGPKTAAYLRNRSEGRPLGNWVGHVTIKGDDGYYYTDGRSKECALGWQNGKDVLHEREVAAIFVPDQTVIDEYKGKCPSSADIQE